MDSFEITNIKVEKANAIHKHRRIRKMASLFRIVEICVILILVSRFTLQLPFAVKISAEYFKDFALFLVSPRFVFILGNVIVAILFGKSGQFSLQDSAKKDPANDFYTEFVQKSEKTQNIHRCEVENREKKSICTEKLLCDEAYTSLQTKGYRRSQSENFKRVNCEKSCRELRRGGTEKFKKSTNPAFHSTSFGSISINLFTNSKASLFLPLLIFPCITTFKASTFLGSFSKSFSNISSTSLFPIRASLFSFRFSLALILPGSATLGLGLEPKLPKKITDPTRKMTAFSFKTFIILFSGEGDERGILAMWDWDKFVMNKE